LRVLVAFHFDLEFHCLTDQRGGLLGRVLNGFRVLIAVDRVRSSMMILDVAVFIVKSDCPVLPREKT
jgi:hypothetical protein